MNRNADQTIITACDEVVDLWERICQKETNVNVVVTNHGESLTQQMSFAANSIEYVEMTSLMKRELQC